jgi:FKBP-type peptidyl-prolyl cis-trans isomerase
MDSISIKVPVTIKAKMTEKLQKRIVDEIETNLKNVNLDLQQMDIQEKRMAQEQADDLRRVQMVHERFAEERQKRLEFKQQNEQKLADTKKLSLGAEIVQGTLERQVDLHVGDNMREVMNVEVLVEDDKIIAIRS